MAKPRTSDRSLAGWLFLAAGVLFLLVIVFGIAMGNATNAIGNVFDLLGYLALAGGFVVLAQGGGRRSSTLARAAFVVAAIGWVLFAIEVYANLPVVLTVLGAIFALVGSLVAGILVFTGGYFSARANLLFLLAMILAAIFTLGHFGFALPAILNVIVVFAMSVLLVISGLFIARKR